MIGVQSWPCGRRFLCPTGHKHCSASKLPGLLPGAPNSTRASPHGQFYQYCQVLATGSFSVAIELYAPAVCVGAEVVACKMLNRECLSAFFRKATTAIYVIRHAHKASFRCWHNTNTQWSAALSQAIVGCALARRLLTEVKAA